MSYKEPGATNSPLGYKIKYSIVIPTYNHCEDLLKPCLESIIQHTDLSNVEVIVVANGCVDSTQKYVESLGYPFTLIWVDEPIGYTRAVNLGIKSSKGDYVVLLNNDCIILDFKPRNTWLEMLERPFINDDKVGITGPSKTLFPPTNSEFIVFYCAMLSRKIIDQLGLLDEVFNPGFGEDIDYSLKATNAGYKIVQVPKDSIIPVGVNGFGQFPVYHKSEGTVHSKIDWENEFNVSSWQTVVDRNIALLKKRYMCIGVIVPAYNARRTIKKTLNSILNQTYKNIKVIVVDDYSKDGTLDIIKDYPVNSIWNTVNKGPSYSRNKGLDFVSDCKYIAYCDADDYWKPNHLADSLKCLLEHDVDLVYSYPEIHNDLGETQYPSWSIPESFDYDYLKTTNYIYISSVLHKYSSLRFDSNLDSIEDWDYWWRLAKSGFKFKDSKLNTSYYLVNSNGYAKKGNNLIHKLMEKNNLVKLNLGCGDEYLDGYINCDLYSDKADMKFDAMSIPFPDNSVDEIRAYHLIEHFTFQGAFKVLKEWFRALKPGGCVVMETPDLHHTCKQFVESSHEDRIKLYGHFFAWPDLSPGQVHYFLYTEEQMMWTLSETGFVNARRDPGDSIYAKSNPHWPLLYLKVVAYKPS